MQAIFRNYKNECYDDLLVLHSRKTDSAEASKMVTGLREIYNNFMNQQIRQIRFFVQQGEKLSDDITANTNQASLYLLIVGILPFIALLCIALVAIVSLIILGNSLNWFRSTD
jgi:hypothetical protein